MNMEIKHNYKKVKEYENKKEERDWKEKNVLYLRELQKFFDRVDNIEDNELRTSITNQMLICDKVLTEIAEDMFKKNYDEGYKKAKMG